MKLRVFIAAFALFMLVNTIVPQYLHLLIGIYVGGFFALKMRG